MTRTRERICFLGLLTILLVVLGPAFAQEGGQKPAAAVEKTAKEKAAAPEKAGGKPGLPFQIQLLETHIRFEVNGDSRKEVHTIVKINNVLGAREFARLTFDYNRAFQQVEIPLVRISHTNGGTSELLPSAVTDAPNPAVEKFPAYQDVRVKSVRILGLADGDTIEYRVITTTTKHPLAPDFWLEHTFDRSGQVLEENYELELPKSREVQIRTSPELPGIASPSPVLPEADHVSYQWHINSTNLAGAKADAAGQDKEPDIVLTTFSSWLQLSNRLRDCLKMVFPTAIWADAMRKVGAPSEPVARRSLYDLVSTEIKTVDLPPDSAVCPFRFPTEVLSSGYGSPQDKANLLAVLLIQGKYQKVPWIPGLWLYAKSESAENSLPRPSLLDGFLVSISVGKDRTYLYPSLEVAPYGVLPAQLRGKKILEIWGRGPIEGDPWTATPRDLPFPSKQRVSVEASIGREGTLKAKVKYTLRGDNELLLRVAFHQTAKEKWKDVAGLLALSDGFRGQVTSVNVSDPLATKDPFTVEYEITQAKFVDWSKKPVRIPALLPQIGLPDPPAKPAAGEAAHAIELGTPLDVDTQMTLKLPVGTLAQAPAGTSVERDYAKFTSKYSATANTVTASRRVNFLLREIAGERAMDYSAFVRAVQNDQAQSITLVPAAADEAKPAVKP